MTLPADAGSAVGVSLTVTDITDDQQPLTTATVVDAESGNVLCAVGIE